MSPSGELLVYHSQEGGESGSQHWHCWSWCDPGTTNPVKLPPVTILLVSDPGLLLQKSQWPQQTLLSWEHLLDLQDALIDGIFICSRTWATPWSSVASAVQESIFEGSWIGQWASQLPHSCHNLPIVPPHFSPSLPATFPLCCHNNAFKSINRSWNLFKNSLMVSHCLQNTIQILHCGQQGHM